MAQHTYNYAPLLTEVPEDVKRLYGTLNQTLESLMRSALPAFSSQILNTFFLCTGDIPGLQAIAAALNRSTAVESDPETLSSAMLFLVAEAYNDQPGERETTDDASEIISILRSLRSCLQQEDRASLERLEDLTLAWRNAIKQPADQGQAFASEPRGPTNRDSVCFPHQSSRARGKPIAAQRDFA